MRFFIGPNTKLWRSPPSSTTSQGLFRKGVCGGGTPQIRNSQKSAKHPSLHITFNEIFGGHLYGRFAKGGEVPSFPQLFGENPILKEVGGRYPPC